MFQSAYSNKLITLENLCDKYNSKLSLIGDKVENNIKFGSSNKVNTVQFIKLKRLRPLINNFNDNLNKCCLIIKNKQQLINKLDTVIN